MRTIAALLFALALPMQAATISDSYLGYSIDLPAGWVQVKTRDQQHHFKDAGGQYPSRISIVRYPIDKADYPTPDSWTQAHFIAYLIAVETSAFPFGSIAYFDSSAAAKLGDDWAPEAFSILFPGDGQGAYCELVRYAAHGDFGYEIYALGDSADMVSRVDYYADILATVVLSLPTSIADGKRLPPAALRPGDPRLRAADILGRTRPTGPAALRSRRAAGPWFPIPPR